MAVYLYKCGHCREETKVVLISSRVEHVIPCPHCGEEARRIPLAPPSRARQLGWSVRQRDPDPPDSVA